MSNILKEGDSLVNYYVMPLLKMNKHSFGGDKYFDNSYLNDKGLVVVVGQDCPVRYWEFDYFKTDFTKDGKIIILFKIPEHFHQDILLFTEGLYSKMSNFAKRLIYSNSGLFYKKKLGDVVVTSKILLVLTKSQILRDWMKEEYNLDIAEDAELLPKPSIDCVFKI
jgi:hypothetical protein